MCRITAAGASTTHSKAPFLRLLYAIISMAFFLCRRSFVPVELPEARQHVAVQELLVHPEITQNPLDLRSCTGTAPIRAK